MGRKAALLLMVRVAMTAPELLAWRHTRGLTQTQAAADLGVKLRAYQYWEMGKRPPPATVVKLIAALKAAG